MGIYMHVWLYRKNYANTNQTELCKRSSQSHNRTLGCAQSHALHHIHQQKADLAQSLPTVALSWWGNGGERGCLCLNHNWFLHRTVVVRLKLLKMSMEMKKTDPLDFLEQTGAPSQTTFLLCQLQLNCSGPESPQGAAALEAHWLGVMRPHATQPLETYSLSGVCHWSGPRWPCPWDISWHQLC